MILKLGVVVPVYNESSSLPKFLDSITQQNSLELISTLVLVDGCSTDNSADIIKEYQKKYKFITYIKNEKRLTPVALNLGIAECLKNNVDLIQFFGAHSAIPSNYFNNLNAIYLRYPDVHIYNANLDFVQSKSWKERAIQLFTLARLGRNWKVLNNIKNIKSGFCSGIFAARKEVFEKIGLFNINFIKNQDADFVARALSAGHAVKTFPDLKYNYKVRDSITGLFKQMYITGFYISKKPKHFNWKHKVPFLFYSFILLLMFVYTALSILNLPSAANILLNSVIAVFSLYILSCILETAFYLIKEGTSAMMLPVLFVGSHLFYAIGSFIGLLISEK